MRKTNKSNQKRAPRTKVAELSSDKKELSGKQMKKVKGGVSDGTSNTVVKQKVTESSFTDGSVRF
ncbi:MAG TPA: hypothetical protein VFC63_07905 [Blastocatellia bacterium]|nr:hypothetical protein [Blastocatellia bacterium]